MKPLITFCCLLLCCGGTQADTFTVKSTADGDVCNASTCTLRGAINAALATPGTDTIGFDIPADPVNQNYFSGGSGQDAYQFWMIQPTSELPSLENITIDGSTAGSSVAGNPTIQIDGSLAGDQNPGTWDTLDGLTLVNNSHINGLSLTNWFNAGVRMGDLASNSPTGANNRVTLCWIGLNMPYAQASEPNYHGIVISTNDGTNNVIGGFMDTEGNVISGNLVRGISIDFWVGGGAIGIFGNKIGTNPEGDLAVPNDSTGIFLSTQAHSNVIIGADLPGLGNLVSGNATFGIHITPIDDDINLTIAGNQIGTDLSGTQSIPNREGIILSRGRNMLIENNLISGNSGAGLMLSASPDPLREVGIHNNAIGVAKDLLSPMPNLGGGIYASGLAFSTQIGQPGGGNLIAHNQCGTTRGCGVVVSDNSNNIIELRHNSIHSNENEGIDLGANRFTPNDPGDFDAGPNRLQNFPEINSAQHDPNGNRINLNFWIDSSNAASDYPIVVDVYAADADGEEGQTWLASTSFTESQWLAGNPVSRTLAAQAPITENDLIVTTATGAGGRTSEFSPGFTLAGQPDFSISCRQQRLTTSPSLSCQINCEAEAVNGWGDEVGLTCTHPDSGCVFSPSEEISFTQEVVPFSVSINHSTPASGLYLNEILGSVDTQGDPIERAEVITIQQLSDDDYLFVDGFDGIICD